MQLFFWKKSFSVKFSMEVWTPLNMKIPRINKALGTLFISWDAILMGFRFFY